METAPHLSPLQVILSRHRLLEQVDNGVKDKRDLYDQLTVSRSTIDRAIRELEAENILLRRGSRCEFTRFGKLGSSESLDGGRFGR
ncbi:GntR family transcriptional regulator [Halogeometricum borinquense]|uniref:GntR family transcriptional regulator n=1 Tax=Halogeometricum borinquense TaxID=60847 RepID=A0A482SY96_9EURY|nr:GntR family transcriptional regulator [Halogeometricum borinquense]